MSRGTKRGGIDRRLVSLALPCLVVLLGAALRFYDLGAESYWYDEIRTLQIATGGMRRVATEFLRGDKPPLYLLLMTLWLRLSGTTEMASRYLSAFVGTASIAVIYAVGWRLFSRRVGLVSAILMMLSEFQIWYAQEARYYALLVFITLVSFYAFLRAVERNLPSAWVVLAVVNALLLFTHTYAVFVMLAQGLFFVTRWRYHKEATMGWTLSQVAVLAFGSPSLFLTLKESLAGSLGPMSWIREPHVRILAATPLIYVGSNYPTPRTAVVALGFLTVVSLSTRLAGRGKRGLIPRDCLAQCLRDLSDVRSELLLVGFWLVCPWMVPWMMSKLVEPIYTVRYTISAAPALYLLLAAGTTAIDRLMPIAAVLGLVVILVAPGLVAYYEGGIKENWREAARYVETEVRAGDAVIVPSALLGRDAFDWYYGGTVQDCELDGERRDDAAIIAAAETCGTSSDRLWLVLRESTLRGGHLDEAAWCDADLRLAEQRLFRGVLIYLFDKAEGDGDTGAVTIAGGPRLHLLSSSDIRGPGSVRWAHSYSRWRCWVAYGDTHGSQGRPRPAGCCAPGPYPRSLSVPRGRATTS